jgi:uncharacterized protein YdaU (DUF1376 family)
MKADAWMPLYIADYLADTMHLSTEQHGAYLLLIMACWKRGGTLPDDEAQLAAMARLPAAAWRKMAPVIRGVFAADAGLLVHGRVSAEAQKAARMAEISRLNGRRGGRPKNPELTQEEPGENPAGSFQGTQSKTPTRVARPSPTPVSTLTVVKAEPSVSGQAARTKGDRLKSDWHPSADNTAYAIGQGFTPAQVDRIADDFRDFWTAKSGHDAAKLDWSATWRRWVRNTDPRKVAAKAAKPQRVGFV